MTKKFISGNNFKQIWNEEIVPRFEEKQDKLQSGTGIEITDDNTINCTLDTEVYTVVTSLPSSPIAGNEKKIHIVLNSEGKEDNIYNEYLWINAKWEKVGEYKAEIDLTPYLTKEEASDTYAKQNGQYPDLTVGTAVNLEGNKDIINDSAYRTSANDEDIKFGTADIQSIKGNAIAWNQLVKNGNFAEGTEGWKVSSVGTCTVSNNVATITNVSGSNYADINQSLEPIIGHKYYFSAEANNNDNTGTTNRVTIQFIAGNKQLIVGIVSSTNKWERVYGINTVTELDGKERISITCNTTGQTRNVCLFDLTLIYGAGNEPTTTEQFESDYQRWFGKPLEYEEYDEGRIRSVKATGIKTVGFNLSSVNEFEGTATEWYNSGERLLWKNDCGYEGQIRVGLDFTATPDTTGAIVKPGFSIHYTDGTAEGIRNEKTNTGNLFGLTAKNKIVKYIIATYGQKGTIKLTNICINFSWSGKRDGEYEPHWEETKPIPIIDLMGKLNGEGESVTIFPDGLKRAGNAYDEIYVENGVTKAIKRVGSVDLGSLSWTYNNDNTFTSSNIEDAILSHPGTKDSVNAITSSKYKCTLNPTTLSEEDNTLLLPNVTFASTTNKIKIHDESVGSDTDALKTKLQGHVLYGELAEPEVYILDNFELPLNYKVDDFGTEQILMPEDSVAPIITTRYGINAVDTLRRLNDRFIKNPTTGETGQVLTKTNNGAEWQDVKGGGSSEVCVIDVLDISGETVSKEIIDKLQNAVNNKIPVILANSDAGLLYYPSIAIIQNTILLYLNLGEKVITGTINISTGECTMQDRSTYDAGPFYPIGNFDNYQYIPPRILISLNSSFSLPYFGNKDMDNEVHIIFENKQDYEVTVNIPSDYISNTDSLTVQPNSFGEVNIVKTSDNRFILRAI